MTISGTQQQAASSALHRRYRDVRSHSLLLASPLSAEDQCIQSMPDASPTKWHLAHTTWFFETVLLMPHLAGYKPFDRRYQYLFNSYYEALGPRHPRPQRGLLTRPTLAEVHAYREHVDAAVCDLLAPGRHRAADEAAWRAIEAIVVLGLNHEQQHQELLLTDILHAFSCNPLLPAYDPAPMPALRLAAQPSPHSWIEMHGGVAQVGYQAQDGFSFDNETPRHSALLQPYRMADRLVNCGEFLQFVEDGGYRNAQLWLSDGWATVQAQGWHAPAYWLAPDDPRVAHQDAGCAKGWQVFGLQGVRALDPLAPVSQLSFYEAAAFAEWAGARLPTEFEWEAASGMPGMRELTGHVWQWTRSSYDPYPGFKPLPGVAAEYNGKFMVGQLVLRGGSVATPAGHTRPTYRNFFPPAARWQFSGLRLAKEL
ncbi:MAG: ergothioneine biosynthesis protein EgtB [Proteobacteria bacterium]|nr:ergothioneine biosynthesis protein EgtB [Pseudomonadota bacterium]